MWEKPLSGEDFVNTVVFSSPRCGDVQEVLGMKLPPWMVSSGNEPKGGAPRSMLGLGPDGIVSSTNVRPWWVVPRGPRERVTG